MPTTNNNRRRNAVAKNEYLQRIYMTFLINGKRVKFVNAATKTQNRNSRKAFPFGVIFGIGKANRTTLLRQLTKAFSNAGLHKQYLNNIKNAERRARVPRRNNNGNNLHRQMQSYNAQTRMT